MGRQTRMAALEAHGLVHPNAGAVSSPLFTDRSGFFLAFDKVQVKYEMLRAHVVEDEPVSSAAEAHGYSRASFYVAARAFEHAGMAGLTDERPGRRGPLKVTGPIEDFVRAAAPGLSGAELARLVDARFGVSLHRRTIERIRR